MDKNNNATVEELQAEQAALQEAKEEEVRAKVIEEFGFDELDDAEKIDKAVNMQMEANKKLSHAIGQKIKIRAERDELAKKVNPESPKDTKATDVSAEITKALEARDLEEMDLSDELKKEVQKVAALTGVSVKKALKDPYILARMEQEKKAQQDDDAAIRRGGKGNSEPGKKTKFEFGNPPDVDMTTEEGRKTWDAYKEQMKKLGH